MAMTATISVSPSSAVTEQKVTASVTVSNSAAFPVTMVNFVPYAYPTGAAVSNINTGVALSPINTGPNALLTVGASSSQVFTFDLKAHGPVCGALDSSDATTFSTTYKVGCQCYSNDGSSFSPTETTVTINYAYSFPAGQQ